jgi:REP element-mobilizing transposase RayT
MARAIRVQFAGAVYHVMARGNERREIFRDDRDRQRFVETLAEAVERFGLRVQAWCLMPNHYHLVVGTPRGNLSRGIGWLQATYTARFNARHRRAGHLFQGRFKAQLVEADEYGRWLVEYVHLNPVRPRRKGEPIPVARAAELKRYEWSSHRDYAGWRKKAPEWLSLDWLAYWGRSRREAQAEYRRAIERAFAGGVDDPWQHLKRGLVLGGEALLETAHQLIGKKIGQEEARWTETADAVVRRAQVRQRVQREADERVRIWARVRLGGERGVEVAREYAYRHSSGVTQLVKRLETEAQEDRKLEEKLAGLRKDLSNVKR